MNEPEEGNSTKFHKEYKKETFVLSMSSKLSLLTSNLQTRHKAAFENLNAKTSYWRQLRDEPPFQTDPQLFFARSVSVNLNPASSAFRKPQQRQTMMNKIPIANIHIINKKTITTLFPSYNAANQLL